MNRISSLTLTTLLLVPLAALHSAEPKAPRQSRAQFLQDQPWPDDKGVHINAHGGGVMFHKGIYYWFGEHYSDRRVPNNDRPRPAVHCYSSTDLYNWKDEGVVLYRSNDPASEIADGCVLERPKVIYNAATKKVCDVVSPGTERHGLQVGAQRSGSGRQARGALYLLAIRAP